LVLAKYSTCFQATHCKKKIFMASKILKLQDIFQSAESVKNLQTRRIEYITPEAWRVYPATDMQPIGDAELQFPDTVAAIFS